MPRRKKTPEEKRGKEIKLRMTEIEYQYVQELAATAGEPEAVYCRRMSLQNPQNPPPLVLVPTINTQVWREMNRPLSNINQLIRILHRMRAEGMPIPDGLLKQTQDELSALKSVRAQLIGKTSTDEGEEAE